MRNIVIDWHRSTGRQVSLVPVAQEELTEIAATSRDEPFAPLSGMTEEQFWEFLDRAVVRALDALDAPFRVVVILSVAGDLSYREIADVLDCPVGTVMSRMARARGARAYLRRSACRSGNRKQIRRKLAKRQRLKVYKQDNQWPVLIR